MFFGRKEATKKPRAKEMMKNMEMMPKGKYWKKTVIFVFLFVCGVFVSDECIIPYNWKEGKHKFLHYGRRFRLTWIGEYDIICASFMVVNV